MKTAIVIIEDVRQITLTPETNTEKEILKLLREPGYEVKVKDGTLLHGNYVGAEFAECKGGYLRAFQDQNSVMIVLKPEKKKEEVKSE